MYHWVQKLDVIFMHSFSLEERLIYAPQVIIKFVIEIALFIVFITIAILWSFLVMSSVICVLSLIMNRTKKSHNKIRPQINQQIIYDISPSYDNK